MGFCIGGLNLIWKVRNILLVIIDSMIIICSVYVAYLLRFDYNIPKEFLEYLPYVITSLLIISIVFFSLFKVYKRVWRYASIGDLLSIIKGATISIGIYFVAHQYGVYKINPEIVVPRSIYPISLMIIILGIGGSRLIWRMCTDSYTKIQPYHRKALIVGAGSAGMMVVKELKQTHSEYYPVAFIDDDEKKFNLEVLGVPVLGNRRDIPKITQHHNIQDIIIALPSSSKSEIAKILEICKGTGCQIKMIPRMNDLINGKVSVSNIRNVSVEDLLGRDPIQMDIKQISGYFKDKVVLITGAGGSIGSELCRQISMFSPNKLLLLGHGENSIYDIQLELRKAYPQLEMEPVIADIQDRFRLQMIFDQYRPDVVFHAAAHKHVPLMENNPFEAIKNNVFGTRNLAECAHHFKTERFVMISTDKAVNPTSIMGATKKIAELIVQGLDKISQTQFSAVRFGNVLGSRGSVIPIFMKQIKEGGPVTVTHPDMIRYFMTIPEAVQLVIQAGALASGGEVFILDMGKPVKISDLAHDLIRLSGLEPNKDIKIEYTGIRPGEKLFEELLSSEEGTIATKHDRIFVGKPSAVEYEHLQSSLKKLERVIYENRDIDVRGIREEIRSIVPAYTWWEDEKQLNREVLNKRIQASMEIVASLEHKLT